MVRKVILWLIVIAILLYAAYVAFLITVILFLHNPKEGFDIFTALKIFGMVASVIPMTIYWHIKQNFKGKK